METSTTTATGSTTNIQGLTSGIQWNDLVDATIAASTARSVTPLKDQITKQTAQKAAWNQLSSLTQTLNDTAIVLRRAGIGGYSASVPPSPTTSRTLLTVATTLAASPGRFRVEVGQLAETAKVGGAAVANTQTALGLAGTFRVNGATITVASTDSMVDVQGKINAANTGSTPTGVTASILSDGASGGRLVLSRDTTGSSGVTITDGTGDLARRLGFIDSRSKPISSAVASAAAALGLSISPQPASIRIGTVLITADLSVDSISAIAARINAAGGAAAVESEQYGSETRFRLVTDGNVSAVAGDANSQSVIDALGMAAGKTGTVHQTVATSVFTDNSNAVAGVSTSLAGLKVDGTASGLAVGDAINIRGTRGDGTAVTIGLVVGSGDTMQTLLDKINDATSGFGSGARAATAGLGPDGRIRIADGSGGASRLSLSLGVTHADGTTAALGTSSVTNAGRQRQLQEGKDAIITIDGTQVTRASNTISDGINGVTLTLSAAEPGTTVDVVVDRDTKATTDAVTKFKDAYNAIRKFFDDQRAVNAPLYSNTMLRGTIDSFQATLRTTVSSNTTYTSLAVSGLALDRFGMLQLDSSKFQSALASKPAEVEALFGFSGVGGAFVTQTDSVTRFGIGTVSQQTKSLDDSSVRLQRRADDIQKRIDDRRAALVARFSKMETLLAQLQNQGSVITNSLRSVSG